MSQHHAKNRPQSFYRAKAKTLDALGKLMRGVQDTMDQIGVGNPADQVITLVEMQERCREFTIRANQIMQEEGLCPKTPSNS